MAVKIKIVVFWLMAPCNMVGGKSSDRPMGTEGLGRGNYRQNDE
jgi:hypothetical protein